MRAYSWILVGSAALACSGGAFTSVPEGSGGDPATGDGGDTSEGASAGVLGRAGRGIGGSLMGGGGKVAAGGTGNISGSATGGVIGVGGVIGFGGDLGIGGDLVAGGSLSMGGTTVSGGSGSTAGNPSTGGGPDPGPDSTCPLTAPPPQNKCVDGLTCSYGVDIRPPCRPKATCDNGIWVQNDPMCKAIHSCGNVMPGAVCDMQLSGACIRSGSQYCICSNCAGNLCDDKATWHCAANSGADPSCPKVAPNFGAACDKEMQCLYGSCSLPESGPTVVTCNGKTWDWEPSVCPF